MDLLFNFVYLLVSAVFVGTVWWGTLRLMDKVGGIDFRKEFREIAGNDIALAIYFGCRLLAAAILFAPLLRVIL